MQEDRVRVYLVYALAAIIVIATTVLGALGRLSSDQVLSILRDVLLSLGWWHAQAPRGAAPAAPTPAPAVPLWLALLLLPTVACHAEWSLFEPPGAPRAGAAQAALGAPSSATQINFDTSAVPLSCPASKGCLAVNAASGRLYFHGTDAVNIEIGQLAPGAAVPAAQLTGQVPAANLTTALGAPPAIGGTTAAAGTFTTVTATSQFTGPGAGLTGLPAAQLSGQVPAANLTTALGAPPAIGGTTAAAGTFTTVTAQSQFTGPGTGLTGLPAAQLSGQVPAASLTTALGAPPAIGGTTAAAGTFTTVTATSQFTGPGTGLTGLPAAQLTGLVAQTRGGLGADVSSSAQHCFVAGPAAGAGALACRLMVAGDLPATAVTPGSYNNPTLVIDQQGRITSATGGSAGGVTLATLIFDAVAFGDGLASAGIASWQTYGGDYTYGAQYQALSPIVVSGVKARSAAASGTLSVSVWVGNIEVATGSTAITGVGNYSVSVTPVSIDRGALFTVAAHEGTFLPHYDIVNIPGGQSVPSVFGDLAALGARIILPAVFTSSGGKPTNAGASTVVYGATAIFSTP